MNQAADFDYTRVPYDYIHCFHHECPRAAECLRHLAGLNAPAHVQTVRCFNPSAWPADAARCPHYRPIKKVTLAWGVTNLTAGILPHLAIAIQKDVRRLWPHTSYARIRHLERPITPDKQKKIERIFAYYAPGSAPRYDRFSEEYDFQ